MYGALYVRDGQVLIQTALSRNTTGYLTLLQTLDRTDAHGAVEQGRIAAYNMICARTWRCRTGTAVSASDSVVPARIAVLPPRHPC